MIVGNVNNKNSSCSNLIQNALFVQFVELRKHCVTDCRYNM